jgi:predicted enzyme related to lactoylglutathione lyase
MFTAVGSVTVYVADQDRAKDFYVNTLGWKLWDDQPLYPGATNRWIAVAPEGAYTTIVLLALDEPSAHYAATLGKSQALTIHVTDLQAVYEQLSAKGVQFSGPPQAQPWGTFTTLIDSEGNGLMLIERPTA